MNDRPPPLKVLLIEDSLPDAELVLRELRELSRPHTHLRVASEDTLRRALAEFAPDIVLCDFSMPGFSGQEALAIVRAHDPSLPFVFVSGTIGEEIAIDALQRGAMDYVLKDNLRRLVPAVERALETARERRERARIEQALRESEERFRSIVESSRDWIWESLLDGTLTYSNAAIERMLGYPAQELVGRNCLEHMHPDDRAEVERALPEILAAGDGWRNWRSRWIHRDGSIRVFDSSAVLLRGPDGAVYGLRGVDHDITELLRQKERIRQLARLHAILGGLGNAVLRADSRQAMLDAVCRVAVEQGGFLAACIGEPGDGHSVRVTAWHGDERAVGTVAEIARAAGQDPGQPSPGARALYQGEWVIAPDLTRARDGVPGWAAGIALRAGIAAEVVIPVGSPPWCALGLFSDHPQAFDADELALYRRLADEIDFAADFIAKSERLEYLAYFDPVTGLPNRASLAARLESRRPEQRLALAVLDLERFGAINQSRGRATGDRLLRAVGERLQALLEGRAFVARLEADAFALVHDAADEVGHELERLESLLDELQRMPLALGREELRIEFSGGLAVAPDHADDPEALEHAATAALAEARRRRQRLLAFDEELRGRAAQRLRLEQELRLALERDEFELFYQPKFSAATQRLLGAEALLRWRHPERGLVSPGVFIPVLEDSSLIVPVGRWAMGEALRTVLAWREHCPGLRLAVNLSARELQHPEFLDVCQALLQSQGGDSPLDLEVTESLLVEDLEHSIALLETLRGLGCKVAIDDFGTGYSSLNYLARLPADEVKIDISFTRQITESPETLALVTHIIGLAHSLGLQVVAEGVEEEEQAKLLRLLRCDCLQGYLLGKPLPAAEFAAQLLGLETAGT
ncbi:EAL domain-containing protein [Vulcaniibacterium gelatinicum]|uniref:EAL domain-containing protein n=1 Tax=Vulcaniibacterium gelatinicum TaxID=2598725 RepID=UPI0011C8F17E|nr:EAL domain-containing protein [Vulcaniibacterium gelatinicum]